MERNGERMREQRENIFGLEQTVRLEETNVYIHT